MFRVGIMVGKIRNLEMMLLLPLFFLLLSRTAHAASLLDGGDPKCTPFKLPPGVSNYQEFCKQLANTDDSTLDQLFLNGQGPSEAALQGHIDFPLKGAVLGCFAGKQSASQGNRVGGGSWNGKVLPVFPNQTEIYNLLTANQFTRLFVNVMNQNWTTNPPKVKEVYPGNIETSRESWSDLMYGGSLDSGHPVWILTYDNNNANSGLLQSPYARLVRQSFDEVRLIEPGLMLGNLFRKASGLPGSKPEFSGMRFALIQVCDANGTYALNGDERKL